MAAVRGLSHNGGILPYGIDFTQAGSLCFSKALLAGLDPSGDAFSVYSEYLDRFLLADPDSRISSLQGRPYLREKLRAQLFFKRKNSKEPQLFSFFSPPCLARLSQQLGLELVVYRLTSGSVTPYCDFRLASGETGRQRLPTVGVLFGCAHNPRDRFLRFEDVATLDDRFNARALSREYSFAPLNSTPWLWDRVSTTAGCPQPLVAVERTLTSAGLLDVPPPSSTQLPDVRHPWELVEDQGRIVESLWARWGKEILVVTFVQDRLKGSIKSRGYCPPLTSSGSKFSVLCYIADPQQGSALDSVASLRDLSVVPVVCLWASGLCSLLSAGHSREVRLSFLRTQGTGERVANAKLRGFVPPSKARTAERLALLAARQNSRARKIDSIRKWCECETCSKSTAYDGNMSKAGPERLITTDYTLQQLLEMLGLWKSGATDRLLDRVCELSVASMDIESRTIRLDMAEPGPGPGVRYAEIDVAALENHPRFVQVPVMMAHMDGISAGCQRNPEGIFTVADDSEEAIRTMMKSYLEWVLRSQRECAKAKAELLAPLLNVTRQYKEAYMNYCRSWHQTTLDRFEEEERNLTRAGRGGGGGQILVEPSGPAPVQQASGSGNPSKRGGGPELFSWDDFVLPTSSKQPKVAETADAVAGPPFVNRATYSIAEASTSSSSRERAEDPAEDDGNQSDSSSVDSGRDMLLQASMKALLTSRPRCFFTPAHFQLADAHKIPAGGGKLRVKKERDFFYLAVRAWSHTIPGRLEKLLLRLVDDYSIFSFYG
jgi:hypothetical protein